MWRIKFDPDCLDYYNTREEYCFNSHLEFQFAKVHFGSDANPCWIKFTPDPENEECRLSKENEGFKKNSTQRLAVYTRIKHDREYMKALYDNAQLLGNLIEGGLKPGDANLGINIFTLCHKHFQPHKEYHFSMPLQFEKMIAYFGTRDTARAWVEFQSDPTNRTMYVSQESEFYKRSNSLTFMFDPVKTSTVFLKQNYLIGKALEKLYSEKLEDPRECVVPHLIDIAVTIAIKLPKRDSFGLFMA